VTSKSTSRVWIQLGSCERAGALAHNCRSTEPRARETRVHRWTLRGWNVRTPDGTWTPVSSGAVNGGALPPETAEFVCPTAGLSSGLVLANGRIAPAKPQGFAADTGQAGSSGGPTVSGARCD